MEKWQSNLPFFFYICYNEYGDTMKKIGLLLLLSLLLTACGTSPKQIVNEAIKKLELVDTYQETLTAKEEVKVLNKVNKRTIIWKKEKDLEHQVERINTKVTKNKELLEQEEYYYDVKKKTMYLQDEVTNEWMKEQENSQDILDYSILTANDVKVEEVKTNKTGIRKYKIELSEEDMKRLFYRNINEEYVSMIINQKGTIYLYVSTTTGYLTQIDIDLTNLVDMQDPDSNCEKMKLEIKYQEYNNLDPIEIPDYVLKTAQ